MGKKIKKPLGHRQEIIATCLACIPQHVQHVSWNKFPASHCHFLVQPLQIPKDMKHDIRHIIVSHNTLLYVFFLNCFKKTTLGKPNPNQEMNSNICKSIGYASVCSFPVILGFTISTFLGTTSSTASTASKHSLTSGCCSEAFLESCCQ